jgi:hypothetical protein
MRFEVSVMSFEEEVLWKWLACEINRSIETDWESFLSYLRLRGALMLRVTLGTLILRDLHPKVRHPEKTIILRDPSSCGWLLVVHLSGKKAQHFIKRNMRNNDAHREVTIQASAPARGAKYLVNLLYLQFCLPKWFVGSYLSSPSVLQRVIVSMLLLVNTNHVVKVVLTYKYCYE